MAFPPQAMGHHTTTLFCFMLAGSLLPISNEYVILPVAASPLNLMVPILNQYAHTLAQSSGTDMKKIIGRAVNPATESYFNE